MIYGREELNEGRYYERMQKCRNEGKREGRRTDKKTKGRTDGRTDRRTDGMVVAVGDSL